VITLGTVSSPVVNGRCTICGRFIALDTSHFHSMEKRKFRGPSKVHIWRDGGAMVTRCDDIQRARDLATKKYARTQFGKLLDDLDDEEAIEVRDRFPLHGARIERGRCTVQPPEADYSWVWFPMANGARGPGITTAVVWYW
jgi:hypothetical protein